MLPTSYLCRTERQAAQVWMQMRTFIAIELPDNVQRAISTY
ncbi:MAG: hypothetical protein R2854_01090 [Caldilineaceae bacterium]